MYRYGILPEFLKKKINLETVTYGSINGLFDAVFHIYPSE
jgi:hypothetical protein